MVLYKNELIRYLIYSLSINYIDFSFLKKNDIINLAIWNVCIKKQSILPMERP